MAAGLTDHVWTLKEVLLFRVPPWPQPKSSNGLARKMIITQRGTGMPTSRQGGVNETLKTGLET
jgi:hypothetical protein